ncbi:MAG: PIN domain nuclease [Deltaproteobacteria bacterium]|nr:PIN domain nuclease [Deltaproteobacteria bacterium]MBW1938110.1 PIN domain nuclease [Deltaproteobacteria bacterium]MBW1965537.1 PIN domain nuclease [Deltaproteobacteria bacterium]MBW2351224.1 PIN domain nuclease [Deltaproteobacteria bacterium]
MAKVIIDTSAWIASFQREGDLELKGLVKRLITEQDVLLPGIIKAEFLRGAKDGKEYEKLSDLLKGLAYLPVEDTFWERLSRFSFELFRKGLTVPLTDTCIALIAIENDVPVVHKDKHFDLIAQRKPLKILTPKSVEFRERS